MERALMMTGFEAEAFDFLHERLSLTDVLLDRRR